MLRLISFMESILTWTASGRRRISVPGSQVGAPVRLMWSWIFWSFLDGIDLRGLGCNRSSSFWPFAAMIEVDAGLEPTIAGWEVGASPGGKRLPWLLPII